MSNRCQPFLLPEEVWRGRALGLIREIEEDTAAQRSRTGRPPLGVAAILGQHPHNRPKSPKKSPAPLFHAVSAKVRRELWEAYRWFVAAFLPMTFGTAESGDF